MKLVEVALSATPFSPLSPPVAPPLGVSPTSVKLRAVIQRTDGAIETFTDQRVVQADDFVSRFDLVVDMLREEMKRTVAGSRG
jgi:hypothetical protein